MKPKIILSIPCKVIEHKDTYEFILFSFLHFSPLNKRGVHIQGVKNE